MLSLSTHNAYRILFLNLVVKMVCSLKITVCCGWKRWKDFNFDNFDTFLDSTANLIRIKHCANATDDTNITFYTSKTKCFVLEFRSSVSVKK